jgi:hypothetical protein
MQYLKAAVGLRNGTGSEAPAVSTSALTLEESMVTVTCRTRQPGHECQRPNCFLEIHFVTP